VRAAFAARVEGMEPAAPIQRTLGEYAFVPTLRPATLRVPAVGNGSFELGDQGTGLGIAVRLVGAEASQAAVSDGLVVYPSDEGRTWMLDVNAEGVEDYIAFERAPARPEVAYEVDLGDDVAGLRLVENVLEFLDAQGAPRLRLAKAVVTDARGTREPMDISVEGCAVDTNPAAPWDRAPTNPGARYCTVRLSWADVDTLEDGPLLVDPAWQTTGSMAGPRAFSRGLGLNVGRILVFGGREIVFGSYNITLLPTAELYDPGTGTFSSTGSLNQVGIPTVRSIVLGDGRVLTSLGAIERYSPTTGTWQFVLANAGNISDLVPLADGRVMLLSSAPPNQPHRLWNLTTLATTNIASPSGTSGTAAQLADGRILTRNIGVGNVAGSEPLFTLANLSDVWAELHVFPRDLGKINEGQMVTIHSQEGEREAQAPITMLLPTTDPLSQTVIAIVTIANPKEIWRPGTIVTGDVLIEEKSVPILIKVTALQNSQGSPVVFIKVGNQYEMRPVKLGENDGVWVEVKSGLKAGTHYVTANSFLIKADIEKSGAEHDH
jgi:hypothetical protein